MLKMYDYHDGSVGVGGVEYSPEKYQWLVDTFGPEAEDGGTEWSAKFGFITFKKEKYRTMFLLKYGQNNATS